MSDMTQVDVKNLNIWFDDRHVIKDVSLGLKPNTVTAVMGPSGCGKTTFIKAINRLNELIPGSRTTGEIWIDGENIYDNEIQVYDLRKKVGMVFQKPNPFPKSIFDNVAFGPRLYGVENDDALQKIVEESLQEAALWDEVKDRLHDSAMGLSGGQQQRLVIARAIAIEPEILLLDEPASALDPISTLKIEELINDLKDRYTIVIVTHNMQQAARVSDYTAFMYMGKLVEFDETTKIFTNPAQKQTEDYITGRYG